MDGTKSVTVLSAASWGTSDALFAPSGAGLARRRQFVLVPAVRAAPRADLPPAHRLAFSTLRTARARRGVPHKKVFCTAYILQGVLKWVRFGQVLFVLL